MMFAADGSLVIRKDGKVTTTTRYTVDPARAPAEIDWGTTDGNRGEAVTGVYRVETDKLTLWTVSPPATRPKAVESPAGSTIVEWILTRAKKE